MGKTVFIKKNKMGSLVKLITISLLIFGAFCTYSLLSGKPPSYNVHNLPNTPRMEWGEHPCAYYTADPKECSKQIQCKYHPKVKRCIEKTCEDLKDAKKCSIFTSL